MDKYKDRTIEWAIEHLEFSNVCDSAKEIIIKKLELHTPKKLTDPYNDGYGVESGYCPNCGLEQEEPHKQHCEDCGQALDWGDEE